MSERVVLAYSGGLDATVAVAYLKETMGVDVVCVAAGVGQDGDPDVCERGDSFEHAAAEGFVKLLGLPTQTWARAHWDGR